MLLRVLSKCRRTFVALLLSSLSALAAAQGQGSWGGATGIVLAVIAVAAMGYLLAMWVVWRVVKAVGIKGALSVAVTILISYAPIGYWMRESEHRNEIMEAQQQAYRNFRAQSEQYITEKCPTERIVTARVLLKAGTGIFLSDAKGPQLDFANIPPAVPLTTEMKRSYDKYGTRFPDEAAVDGQFHQPLKWTVAMNPYGVLSQGPAFVEFVEQRGPTMKQKVRMARFRWWKENTTPAELEKVLKLYESHRFLEQDNPYLTSPVDDLKSTYELEMRDCGGQVFSDTSIDCCFADSRSKALGDKFPSVECNRMQL